MLEYLCLQRTLWERRFRDWQLAPWVVYTLGPLLFFLLGHVLLNRGEWTAGLVVFMGLSSVQPLSGQARNNFLRLLYRGKGYRMVRMAENAIVLAPFVLLLLVESFLRSSIICGAGTLVLCIVGMSMVGWIRRPAAGRALPTPFSRQPFEFAVGVRRFWWMLLIVVLLLVQGIRVGNYELSAFTLLLLALTGTQMESETEPGFYVWIHSLTARAFLWRKIRLGVWHQAVLTFPVVLALMVCFPGRWLPSLVIFTLGLLYVILGLLVKYALFPKQIHVGQAFIIALGMIIPPLLLIIIPIYYQRALTRMEIALP